MPRQRQDVPKRKASGSRRKRKIWSAIVVVNANRRKKIDA
jgi:hypothetical protein